ncbi:MAG: carboxypeptidase M32 [Myxococcota bacterium]|jgi:carboxypeptidase Taq|nr:carboxypeptidase M32 [Myxococcota bacterium]
MTAEEAYEFLLKTSLESSYLGSLGELAAWDQRTYLPRGGQGHRAEQLATLARLLHERITDPRIGDCLAAVERTALVSDPDSPQAVNVREWRRDYDLATRIPERLAVDIARVTAEAESVWEQAKQADDWHRFEPYLAQVLDLQKEKAHALGYLEEPYDALLDRYERGETAATLEPLFRTLKDSLVQLLEKIEGSGRRTATPLLARSFDIESQKRFCRTVASALGYDLECGRIDVSAHPFTIGIGPGDVRITTRYNENQIARGLFGTLHEAGHAMYEQGLPREHWGTPRGQAVSLGIHESQSRLWENFVGRSRGFWSYVLPVAQAELPRLSDTDLDGFLLAINTVAPSLVRVEADEVTYNLHILLRFELELSLMRGELSVSAVPEAWRMKMREYLGIEPSSEAAGALQDVHWAAGLVGYFPTYTLGNVFAAALYAAADREIGPLEERFACGDFASLKEWLRTKIHEVGSTYSPRQLILRATGELASPKSLISYYETKYSELYHL